MSGRPASPSYTVLDWAPDANYPAGAETWSSNPTKVAPPGAASVGFTPGQGNAAQYHNYLHNKRYTENAAAKAAITDVLTFVGQAQALNFPVRLTGPGGASQNSAFFVPATCKWFVCCNTEDVRSSFDQGLTWNQESGVAGAGAGENTFDGDADASGNVVISTSTRYAFALNASTGTWTKPDVYGGAWSTVAHVAYSPTANQWCWVGETGGVIAVQVSADRATWFGSSTPLGSSWSANALDMKANKASGRVVVVGSFGAGAIRVAYSDNGGNSWTTLASDLVTTITSPTVLHLSHNADESAWYLVVGETSGTPSCEVWRSTDDGASWTKVATLSATCLYRIGGFGALLVSVAKTSSGNFVVYSLDAGTTWEKTGMIVEGTPNGMFVGAGRALALTSSNAYLSVAMGKPSIGAVT